MTKMILLDGEDGRPGNYYVSCRSGEKWSLLYGPFGRHREAIEALPAARRAAESVDPWTVFYGFGTARTADDWQPAPVGVLNRFLPVIPASDGVS